MRIVSLYMYSAASDVYTDDFTQSVPAALAQTTLVWETNEGERVMSRQYAGTAVIISEGHKEVVNYAAPAVLIFTVNIRTAGAASKCSSANAIRIRILIRPNSSQNYSYSSE